MSGGVEGLWGATPLSPIQSTDGAVAAPLCWGVGLGVVAERSATRQQSAVATTDGAVAAPLGWGVSWVCLRRRLPHGNRVP